MEVDVGYGGNCDEEDMRFTICFGALAIFCVHECVGAERVPVACHLVLA
jgi:hypothetical protein